MAPLTKLLISMKVLYKVFNETAKVKILYGQVQELYTLTCLINKVPV